MNEQDLAPINKEILSNKTIQELAMEGGNYTILSGLELTPGYNPSTEYTGMSHPNFPIDRYATKAQLSTGTLISIERGNQPVEQQNKVLAEPHGVKKWLSLLGKRKSSLAIPTSDESLYGVQAQVGQEPSPNDTHVFTKSEADVWCSPEDFPENLQVHIGSQQKIILRESLFIKPDYSNLPDQDGGKILTTQDYFSILIKPGAKVFIQRGGGIGNIKIHVVEGSLFIPCNPNIRVPLVRRNA